MKTLRLTMAQALVRFLDRQYLEVDGKETKFVAGVFGIFGHGVVAGLGEALAGEGHSLRFHQGKNEQGAAHAAIGFAKQRDRREIMAVTSSIGPGALNMVSAAGTATVNRIPVLFLPADSFACRQPDPVLQQVEQFGDPNVTANDAFKAVSRYWDRVSRPEQLMSAMINAMRVLTDPAETGAVTIALPQDVQGEAYEYPAEFLERRVHHLERRIPTAGQVGRAVAAIAGARRPLVVCGGGARYSGAGPALEAFCAAFHIPFGETQAGKGIINWDNPYNLSGVGLTGSQAANRLARKADLVIALGTRLGDFTTCSKWLFQAPGCRVLGINGRPSTPGSWTRSRWSRTRDWPSKPSPGSCPRGATARTGGTEIEGERSLWKAEVDRLYAEEIEGGLSQARCLGELNDRLLPPDAIVVAASGSIPSDMQRLWRPRARGSYHLEYGFSCMGYEIAGALGARLAEPEREVVAILGDGAYAMLHSELLTAVQEGLKLIVVVLDNAGFQCIENLQASQGIRHFGNEWRARDQADGQLSGERVGVDFAKNAESWGALGLRARSVGEFREAVARALREKGPVLIDAKVDPRSMTHGYEAWWRVGTAEVSGTPAVAAAAAEMRARVAEARKY